MVGRSKSYAGSRDCETVIVTRILVSEEYAQSGKDGNKVINSRMVGCFFKIELQLLKTLRVCLWGRSLRKEGMDEKSYPIVELVVSYPQPIWTFAGRGGGGDRMC